MFKGGKASITFESIAKTNTTQTITCEKRLNCMFESIAKTNTTQTSRASFDCSACLRVLLKQIQHKLDQNYLLHQWV